MTGILLMAAHNAVAALVLAIVVWGITRIVRRPAVAHVLWLLVLLRLIAPPVFGVDYATLPANAPRPVTSVESSMPVDAVMSRDSRINVMWQWWLRRRVQSSSVAEIGHQEQATVVAETSGVSAATIDVVADWLPPAWAGIAVILATIVLRRVQRMRRLLLQLPPGPAALQEQAARIAEQLGLRRAPQVRLSSSAAGPFVWSAGSRPFVVLPESLLAELSETQIAMVLTHELAHLRRRDHWVRWIEVTAVLACWWNPLLYWARRRLHEAEELCCDAWVAWLYPDQHRTYADALLRAAELSGSAGSPAPLLMSPLFRVHPLRARIAMIVQGRTPHRNSRGTVLALAALALIVLPSYVRLTAADAETAEPAVELGETVTSEGTQPFRSDDSQLRPVESPKYPGRLKVKVHAQDDPKSKNLALAVPVEGATIGAFLGVFDDDGNALTVSGKTGADGTCSVPVPYGHLQVMPPMLPAGYWIDFTTDNEHQNLAITTSPDAPVYSTAYIVRRGTVWNIRAFDAETGEPVGMLQCGISPVDQHQLNRSGPTVLDANGFGRFTPPAISGKFSLSLFGPADGREIRDRMQYRHIDEPKLTFDEGFDPDQIESVTVTKGADDSVTTSLTDQNNKTAKVEGATVGSKGPTCFVDVKVRRWTPVTEVGSAGGTVVDPNGQPVSGVRVNLWMLSDKGDRGWTGYRARTNAAGRFTVEGLSLRSANWSEHRRIVAAAACDGFSITDSQPCELPAETGDVVNVGIIRLNPGHRARIQVLDVLGGPAVGAIVGTNLDMQPTARNITNDRGEVVVRDLPAGKVQLYAAYGSDAATTEIVVPEVDNEDVVATLRLQPQLALGVESRHGGPAPAAQPAPALKITAWTDGQARSLEKLRGRVVVLYFWDRKEEACEQELAIIDHLQQRFTDDGVVFLGIHPSGSTLDEVRAFMKEKDWRLPTGLDQAGEGGQSQTVEAYGVSSSSFVVIAANGYIAFNRDAVMDDDGGERLYKQAAQALNINLEEDEQSEAESKEEGCDKCMQILEYIQRRAIENTLGK